MELKFGMLADYVTVGNRGKLIIVGEFERFWAKSFPFRADSFYLVARIEATVAEGTEHRLRIDIRDADGRPIVDRPPELPVKFGTRGPGRSLRHQVISQIQGLTFARPGDYVFHLLVDGREVGTVPLRVDQRAA